MENRGRGIAAAIAGALILSGCATASFAPPRVQTERRVEAGRVFTCDQLDPGPKNDIDEDIEGSIQLINNYIRAYRCASHEAADGRQVFEVPSMLALIAAGIGPALGLSSDAALVATAGAGIYGRANSYYAPKEKAAVLDTALDAVLCAKAAAVGFDFFDLNKSSPATDKAMTKALEGQKQLLQGTVEEKAGASAELSALAARKSAAVPLDEISDPSKRALERAQPGRFTLSTDVASLVAAAGTAQSDAQKAEGQLRSVNEQIAVLRSRFELPRIHYEMVATALLMIERVLAQRLSNIGSFDSAGIAAEFEQLGRRKDEAQDDKDDLEQGQATDSNDQALTKSSPEFEPRKAATETELMQAKLQICVVRAKV